MLPRSTAMISSDRGVFINGGEFHQHNYHGQTSTGNEVPFDILKGAAAPSALHDSGASFDRPKCHPRTRTKIQEIIMHWIFGKDEEAKAGKQFMWLNGAAGCGKSAIAQSTIESCIEQGMRFASFFFNKSDPTRNHAGSLVATLAYQLYGAFPGTEVQAEILSAIKKDPLIFKKTLQQQFTALIIQPLRTYFSSRQSTEQHPPFLIVIDGLDECTDRDAQKAILTGLADSVRISDLLCIQIFVASRPEHDIKLSFSSQYLKDMHTGLSLDLRDDGDDAESDIRLYLFDRFAQIKDDFNNHTTGRKLDQDWPGNRIIEILVRKSSRQFIYAATVIRYVESTRHRPDHRLDIILNLRLVNGDHPFAELDKLYATILESALDIEKVLHVLALYLMDLRDDICCSVIEKLLSYDEGEVETLFCDMGALVQVYKDKEQHYDPEDHPLYLRFLHASFRDYLCDGARSKQFHIDMDCETIKHITHALQYLALCCSSSFNPNSHAGAPIAILRVTPHQIRHGNSRSTIFLELRQSVLSFPIKKFLEPHSSTHTFPRLVRGFVAPFLKLLEAIVFKDPTSSYIQNHQLGILRSILMQQVEQYFNDDTLALALFVFYYCGSHRFVPAMEPARPLFYLYVAHPFSDGSGSLCLSYHRWSDTGPGSGRAIYYRFVHQSLSLALEDNIYHRFMRRLPLRDRGGPPKYALGPIMHERAALACFKELAGMAPLLPSSPRNTIVIAPVTDDAEEDAYPKLIFDSATGGQWQFKYSGELKLEGEELHFVLLGYLIFLLPRCGRSDALVAACEEHGRTSYIDQPHGPFPVRRRLLHKEIKNYLARVLIVPASHVLTKILTWSR